MSNEISNDISNEEMGKNKIILQATYYGGCGSSVIAKKKVVENLKKYILENYDKNLPIEINLKNYKRIDDGQVMDSPNDIVNLDPSFNETEYNIFLILGNKRKLIGTSDHNNKESFYPVLQNSLNGGKEEFLKSASEKIIKLYKNQNEI